MTDYSDGCLGLGVVEGVTAENMKEFLCGDGTAVHPGCGGGCTNLSM